MRPLGIILLAAGLGKRMKSDLPKVLHRLGGRPLILYPLKIAQGLEPEKVVVVVGNGAEEVRQSCGKDGITWVTQQEQLGTGHAVRCAGEIFSDFRGDLLILSGDVPFVTHRSLAELLRHHHEQNHTVSLMTALVAHPAGYGRILRDAKGEMVGIVEERDATKSQTEIREVNAGIYVVSSRFLFSALDELSDHNQQGEYYLPDIVGIASGKGEGVGTVQVGDAREILGINTREELALMEKDLQERINRKWMESGVTLKDPQTAYIEEGALIGKDTIIGPNTHLLGRTIVGERCLIDGGAYVVDTRLGNGAHLKFSVVLTGCELGEGVEVGPFSHLRPGTVLKRNVHIGSFVEVKNSSVGEETKANHLAYIGDATVGRETNIGAGTITCNYDGFDKHRTTIGDRVQVGSNTQLVAPVVVGDDAYIGAGSTITQDVPSGVLALSRVAQKHVKGWVQRFREKHGKA
ncbi:MAG: bifunctional UDP-N-acetylglucosamine diphosphorylase/glucosamine-1-phosphate N-acetyltransferase GlmU [Candidatus Binatia bacterium]